MISPGEPIHIIPYLPWFTMVQVIWWWSPGAWSWICWRSCCSVCGSWSPGCAALRSAWRSWMCCWPTPRRPWSIAGCHGEMKGGELVALVLGHQVEKSLEYENRFKLLKRFKSWLLRSIGPEKAMVLWFEISDKHSRHCYIKVGALFFLCAQKIGWVAGDLRRLVAYQIWVCIILFTIWDLWD